ncbi:MAG TPA: hypothetical protein VHX67_02855 [Acidimicrobiales bacterium]|nr:hypothetical protein [Acidimicrobiales bacterium]
MPTSRVTESSNGADDSNIAPSSTVTPLRGEPVLFAPTDTAPTDTAPSDTEPSDTEPEGDLTIECDCCALRHTAACEDCVVSFLLEREPDDAVVIDADEARAMRMLERAGLVPTLRFSTQAG